MEDNYYSETEYAGFWTRFAAYLIDGLIINIALYGVLFVFGLAGFSALAGSEMLETGEPDPKAILSIASTLLMYAFTAVIGTWLYFSLQESSESQATIGKRALGIIVTDLDGERISFGRATGRYFGKIVSSMIFLVGYIMAGFTEKRQALHDIMANTLVLRE